MRWLRLVGSLKSYVSSAEYSLFYRALLQKRPIILRSLLIVATPDDIPCKSPFGNEIQEGEEGAEEEKQARREGSRAGVSS